MIKYYDETKIPQYDENHRRISNWDANKEYAENEYCHVYFRIDTSSYRSKQGIGFQNENDREDFYNEVYKVMKSLNWNRKQEKYGLSECHINNGKCELHIHPDELSGDVKKSDIKVIAETLENNRLFNIRWVDIYEDCYDITKEEQIAHLETKKNEIRKMIFESCKTSRRNKFCYATEVFSKIGSKFELDKLGMHFRSYYCYGETLEYMNKIAEELANDGYVELRNNEGTLYIRSLNKTELKALKLKEIA